MKPARPQTSFTLVEMLVAVAIFGLLVLLLASIMNSATQLWLHQSAKEESFREARAALNTLSRDLNGAVVSTNTAWYYADSNSVPRLAFLTTLPQDAQPPGLDNSDICAVGYSLEYTNNDAGSAQENMSLYRYIGFSGWTYTNIISGDGNINNLFASVDNVNVVKALIARDVSQFAFTGYTNDSTGAPQPENQAVLPAMIDIGLTALNDRTAKLLTSQAMWQNTNSLLLQRNEETFHLRMRTIPQ